MNITYEVAKSIHRAYSTVDPQPAWSDLSTDAIDCWMMVAADALRTYRDCTSR